MKIVQLNTGLFPDAQTVIAALRRMEAAHSVESIDLMCQEVESEAWDKAVAAILTSDLSITI
ncbi:MAG: hypothetical protein KKA22_00615 [Gammaproteobacteria bacterium]|jgi:hypothetical protein|nr:hypothetical protein [Gammaproteobacteria bacterium]MBU1406635.1 hypothetical protein [Gammaproteobacteria bacterium]MBU1530943.1 hypothetical protein [Gammaproteobacteria bacterium]